MLYFECFIILSHLKVLLLMNQTILPRIIIIYRYIKLWNLGHRKIYINYFMAITIKYLQNIIKVGISKSLFFSPLGKRYMFPKTCTKLYFIFMLFLSMLYFNYKFEIFLVILNMEYSITFSIISYCDLKPNIR